MTKEADKPGPIGKVINTYLGEPIERVLGFNPFSLKSFLDWTTGWGISRGLVLTLIFFGLLSVLSQQIPNFPAFAAQWLVGTSPVWLPIGLWIAAWYAWIFYVRTLFLSARDPILLEIKVPREIMKSPRAMEMALTSFWINSGEVTFIHRAWNGSVRPWFSLELASFGGEVHFYVWCWKTYKNVVESAFYAQYPNIEIREAEDYALRHPFDPDHSYFCTDYMYEPKGDEYPLKSYIDFELDKDPKDEYRVDPLGQVFELLSGIKPHEMIWVQIMLRKEGKSGILNRTDTKWAERIDKAVKDIRKKASISPGKEEAPESDEKKYGFPRPTWGETRVIETLERHKGKLPFEVGIRAIYTSTKGSHGPTATAMRWMWRPFNSPDFLNGLRPKGSWGHNVFDYPWQDWNGIRDRLMSQRYLDAYRRRSWFYEPWKVPSIVMSTETLATIYHFPSATIMSPGLQRIPATKAEPPPNLPK